MAATTGRRSRFAGGGALCLILAASEARAQSVEDLRALSLEDLGNVQVTSVAKRAILLSEAPAAIYVITADEARRSGAVSLPEILRLAPNLTVARQDAQNYAISARGFNSYQASNKLLVLIDGRSVYTPLHGGVFWDQQQIALADMDRIEVISGPGGALWGANAFNGVINVISKPAAQTQGFLLDAAAGNVDAQAMARYGGEFGELGAFRIHATALRRGETRFSDGAGRDDAWSGFETGFRTDLSSGANAITLQGDYFRHKGLLDAKIAGGNILARWKRPFSGFLTAEVQTYYDVIDRNEFFSNDYIETFDADGKLIAEFRSHTLVAGAGYRTVTDRFETPAGSLFFVDPSEDTFSISNFFIHDDIAVRDDLTASVGLKYEYSTFTGGQWLPSIRVAWRPTTRHLLWSGVSRAVRTPTHIDRNLNATGLLDPAKNFGAEEVVAYEAGYRGRPVDNASLSVSLYFNDYDDLRILTLADGRLRFGNAMRGYGYGAEIWGEAELRPWWTLKAGVNFMEKRLTLEQGALPAALDQHQGNDPDFQIQLRSQMNLSDRWELDLALRAVDDLENPAISGYLEADARVAWRLADGLALSLSGRNLFDAHHPETAPAASRGEVRRSVHLGLRVSK